jgi:hypothetical protein
MIILLVQQLDVGGTDSIVNTRATFASIPSILQKLICVE